jgi:TolB-like protein/AraC-like DNA-binding protein/tetratricopeptide (TPR) repeat protein
MRDDLSVSDTFYKKLAEIVEANLENEQFGVDDLAREIGLSRSQVHRKLHDATGQSISHFIREIRLQRAHEMLVDEIGTASEIAYKVGFGSPTYFSKCFVEYFGYTPGEAKHKSSAATKPTNPSPRQSLTGWHRIYLFAAATLAVLVIVAWFIYDSSVNSSSNATPRTNSIAVLYFDNISGDASQDYLSDGVTDEIISRLSMIRGLRVPGLSSVKPFRRTTISLREIADQLNVNVVLEGSVKKSGNKLRVTARLIDISNNSTLWTEVYDRDYQTTEIFEIQSSIAKAVATRFQLGTTPQIESSRPPTASIEAYDLFLQATSHTNPFGIGMRVTWHSQAELQLKKAIKLDAGFAPAYLELAKIYNEQFFLSAEGAGKKDSIRILIRLAINKDPRLAESYIHMASISSSPHNVITFFPTPTDSTWFWLRKAYELDPLMGLMGYATLYSTIGNFAAAVHCYNHVLKFRPWHTDALLGKAVTFGYMDLPDSSTKYLALVEKLDRTNPNLDFQKVANISLMMHRYLLRGDQQGIMDALTRLFPNDKETLSYRMGIALLFARKYTEAEKYYQVSSYRDMDVGLLLIETGRPDSGRFLLTQALELRHKLMDRVFIFDLARIHAVLGNKKEAIRYFRETISGGFKDVGWFRHDPFMDYVRNDPEFKAILNEVIEDNNKMLKRMKDLENLPADINQLQFL